MVGVEVAYIRLHTLALDFGAAIGDDLARRTK